jgi:hypothetical protein
MGEWRNPDGTRFKWFDMASFPVEPRLVLARSSADERVLPDIRIFIAQNPTRFFDLLKCFGRKLGFDTANVHSARTGKVVWDSLAFSLRMVTSKKSTALPKYRCCTCQGLLRQHSLRVQKTGMSAVRTTVNGASKIRFTQALHSTAFQKSTCANESKLRFGLPTKMGRNQLNASFVTITGKYHSHGKRSKTRNFRSSGWSENQLNICDLTRLRT